MTDELATIAYHQVYRPTTPAVIEAAKRRGRPVQYVDNEGYTLEILAASSHPSKPYDVCFERRAKTFEGANGHPATDVRIWISVEVDGIGVYDSSISSYNPYFGCTVSYIGWHKNVLIAVYTSKSDTYAFRFDPEEVLAQLDAPEGDSGDWDDEPDLDRWEGWGDSRQISHDWAIIEEYLVSLPDRRRTQVEALSILVCAPVEKLSLGQARQRGLIPQDYSQEP